MLEDALGDGADGVAGLEGVAGLGDGGVVPGAGAVEGVDVESALEEVSGLLGERTRMTSPLRREPSAGRM